MSIADNIKRLRASENLSQAELGKIAGVTDKAVSPWEAGTKTPRMGAVEKMAAHFGVPKSAILDDEPDLNVSAHAANKVVFDEQEVSDHLIAFYGKVKDLLTEDDKDDLLAVMELKAERNKRKRDNP